MLPGISEQVDHWIHLWMVLTPSLKSTVFTGVLWQVSLVLPSCRPVWDCLHLSNGLTKKFHQVFFMFAKFKWTFWPIQYKRWLKKLLYTHRLLYLWRVVSPPELFSCPLFCILLPRLNILQEIEGRISILVGRGVPIIVTHFKTLFSPSSYPIIQFATKKLGYFPSELTWWSWEGTCPDLTDLAFSFCCLRRNQE